MHLLRVILHKLLCSCEKFPSGCYKVLNLRRISLTHSSPCPCAPFVFASTFIPLNSLTDKWIFLRLSLSCSLSPYFTPTLDLSFMCTQRAARLLIYSYSPAFAVYLRVSSFKSSFFSWFWREIFALKIASPQDHSECLKLPCWVFFSLGLYVNRKAQLWVLGFAFGSVFPSAAGLKSWREKDSTPLCRPCTSKEVHQKGQLGQQKSFIRHTETWKHVSA